MTEQSNSTISAKAKKKKKTGYNPSLTHEAARYMYDRYSKRKSSGRKAKPKASSASTAKKKTTSVSCKSPDRRLTESEIAAKLKRINSSSKVDRVPYLSESEQMHQMGKRGTSMKKLKPVNSPYKELGDIYGPPKFYRFGENGNSKKKRNPSRGFMGQ